MVEFALFDDRIVGAHGEKQTAGNFEAERILVQDIVQARPLELIPPRPFHTASLGKIIFANVSSSL